jgi:hypothetical protein
MGCFEVDIFDYVLFQRKRWKYLRKATEWRNSPDPATMIVRIVGNFRVGNQILSTQIGPDTWLTETWRPLLYAEQGFSDFVILRPPKIIYEFT